MPNGLMPCTRITVYPQIIKSNFNSGNCSCFFFGRVLPRLVEAKGGEQAEPTTTQDVAGNDCTEERFEKHHSKTTGRHSSRRAFLAGDLSTFETFASSSAGFPAVRRTYATTMKPLMLQIRTRSGLSTRFGAARGHHVDITYRCITGVAR